MTKDRNVLIDGTKLLLAFSVVFMHLAPTEPELDFANWPLLTFTVPFFFTIALYFFVRKVRKSSEVSVGELNFERLLLPYCAWTVIYVALRMFKYRSNLADLHLAHHSRLRCMVAPRFTFTFCRSCFSVKLGSYRLLSSPGPGVQP